MGAGFWAGVIFIILLVIAIKAMEYEFNRLIKKFDGFDRPSLNRDVKYTILGMCLCSFLIGAVFTMIILEL